MVLFIFILENYSKIIISIFIVIFLSLISLEKICLQFKSKLLQKEKDNLNMRYYELKGASNRLKEINKEYEKIIKDLVKNLK